MGAIEKVTNLKTLDTIVESVPRGAWAELIPLLQKIQKAYGYLPEPVLVELSRRVGLSVSRIYGVATFYEQFHLAPRGRHTVRCCRGTACHVLGGHSVANAIQQVLNIEPGQTTEDLQFTFETVACLGTCFLAPVMMVDHDYYGHLSTDKIGDIFERYR
jgi:NADH:ubiquinone oxidoreductase subunit E